MEKKCLYKIKNHIDWIQKNVHALHSFINIKYKPKFSYTNLSWLHLFAESSLENIFLHGINQFILICFFKIWFYLIHASQIFILWILMTGLHEINIQFLFYYFSDFVFSENTVFYITFMISQMFIDLHFCEHGFI